METEPTLVPVVIDGKVIPGLFSFDHLERNPVIVREALIHDLKQIAAEKVVILETPQKTE